MNRRLVVLLAITASLTQCAEALAPIDPGDGAMSLGDARSDGARDGNGDGMTTDAGPVPCNNDIHDGARCAVTHDACLINFSCGATISCDCGNDGLWHCTRTDCNDAGR